MDNVLSSNSGEVFNSAEEEGARIIRVGKKVLLAINYQDSHKEEADESYNRLKEKGYKFRDTGPPAERRVEALVVEGEADKTEVLERGRMSMERSIDELTSGCSKLVGEVLRGQLEDWSEYFSDSSCELPDWFKKWAWRGMTKLGGYNTGKKRYDKRSKKTMQTFPPLDKEALDGVLGLLKAYHGGGEIDPKEIEGLDEKSIKKCDFNALYSHYVNERIVPTPEREEEISGSWREYGLEDKDAIARAANGTGWCIVSPKKVEEYLERPDSSFVFFHLKNPSNGELDYHACASIRMENGKVAEISGRSSGPGQMLEDSLVETVEEKVLSLPGGEEKRQAFEDRKELIRLCKKEGELTKEELEFVYEVNCKIEKLELHTVLDWHVMELKSKYGIKEVVEKGVDRDDLIDAIISGSRDESVNEENVLQNLEDLIEIGADHNRVLSSLSPLSIWENFDRLIECNVEADAILNRMGPSFVAAHLEKLLDDYKDKVQIDAIIGVMDRPGVAEKVGLLLDRGADYELLVKKMWTEDILKNADIFEAHKIKINYEVILDSMGAIEKIRCYDAINDAKKKGTKGVEDFDIYKVVSELDSDQMMYSTYSKTVRDLLLRDDIDPIRFADALSEENLDYLGYYIVEKMNKELRQISDNEDEQERADLLRAKIEELGGEVEDDDFWSSFGYRR